MLRSAQPSQFSTYPSQYIDTPGLAVLNVKAVVAAFNQEKALVGGFSVITQYCQDRNINILNRVCRELTRLSRSKHTLVNILTIGEIEHP